MQDDADTGLASRVEEALGVCSMVELRSLIGEIERHMERDAAVSDIGAGVAKYAFSPDQH